MTLLSATEIVAAEERFLGARVRALLLSLQEKDRSTEQHTRRVAMLSVQVGEQLRLPPATLAVRSAAWSPAASPA